VDVLIMSKPEFNNCYGSPENHADLTKGLTPSTKLASILLLEGELTVSEFWRGIKLDKTHYAELKDDKNFNIWNCGIGSTAFIHQLNLFLMVIMCQQLQPKLVFLEICRSSCMLYFKLKSDKGTSLVRAYKSKQDAQSVYKAFPKHAKSSTAAQLSGDALFKSMTSARYLGNWIGTSFTFVIQWKEQDAI
jgi:hypothetical protein